MTMPERAYLVGAGHIPTVAEQQDNRYGVYCVACSLIAEDYVWPCIQGVLWDMPAVLVAADALAAAREELAQTRIDRDERLTLRESSDLAKMVDAAREELAALKVQYAGVQMERDLANEQLRGWRKRAAEQRAVPAATPQASVEQDGSVWLDGIHHAASRWGGKHCQACGMSWPCPVAVPGDGEQAATTCGHQYWGGLRQPGDRQIVCTLPPHTDGDHEEPETGSFWSHEPRQWGNVATGDPKPIMTVLCSDKAGFHGEHYYRAEPGNDLSHCPGSQPAAALPTSGQA